MLLQHGGGGVSGLGRWGQALVQELRPEILLPPLHLLQVVVGTLCRRLVGLVGTHGDGLLERRRQVVVAWTMQGAGEVEKGRWLV